MSHRFVVVRVEEMVGGSPTFSVGLGAATPGADFVFITWRKIKTSGSPDFGSHIILIRILRIFALFPETDFL